MAAVDQGIMLHLPTLIGPLGLSGKTEGEIWRRNAIWHQLPSGRFSRFCSHEQARRNPLWHGISNIKGAKKAALI
jgi:hypothetical protein